MVRTLIVSILLHEIETQIKQLKNSGVSVGDSEICDMTYYGVIDEIWVLDYHLLTVPVLKCDWV